MLVTDAVDEMYWCHRVKNYTLIYKIENYWAKAGRLEANVIWKNHFRMIYSSKI